MGASPPGPTPGPGRLATPGADRADPGVGPAAPPPPRGPPGRSARTPGCGRTRACTRTAVVPAVIFLGFFSNMLFEKENASKIQKME